MLGTLHLAPLVAAFGRRPLWHQLAALVLATAIPILAVTVLMFTRLVANERDGIRQGLMVSAKTLANLVDNEIDTHAAIASTLAVSPTLQSGDLEGFWSEAKKAIKFVPGSWLALSTPDGPIIVNTLAPFGTTFPKHAAPDVVAQGFKTGQPQVGDLLVGPVAKRQTSFVEVPVYRDGVPVYSISIALPPDRMLKLIEAQFNHGEVVAIVDRNKRFVARVPDHQQRLGTLASEGWRTAMARAPEGWVENLTVEGSPSLTAYAPTKHGWSVGVAQLEATIAGPVNDIFRSTALAAAAMLALSALLAMAIAGHASRGMTVLAATTGKLESGELVDAPVYATITFATIVGAGLSVFSVDPVKALFWSAVINGVAAPPVMVLMMLMTRRTDVMGRFPIRGWLSTLGWLATAVMCAATIILIVTSVRG